jgi:hypothetical protein
VWRCSHTMDGMLACDGMVVKHKGEKRGLRHRELWTNAWPRREKHARTASGPIDDVIDADPVVDEARELVRNAGG